MWCLSEGAVQTWCSFNGFEAPGYEFPAFGCSPLIAPKATSGFPRSGYGAPTFGGLQPILRDPTTASGTTPSPEALPPAFGDSTHKSSVLISEENLADLKNKLKMKNDQLELHEKHNSEIMDLLKIPKKNQFDAQILPSLKHLTDSYDHTHEEIEVGHWANAEAAYEAYSNNLKD